MFHPTLFTTSSAIDMEAVEPHMQQSVHSLSVSPASVEFHGSDRAGRAPDTAEALQNFHWTPKKLVLSIGLFLISAAFEVGGGWLVWEAIRDGKPWWWAVLGSLVLAIYGWIPTLQPVSNFGRIYAVYGGFFIVYSYGWGWALDGQQPDKGDFIGGAIALFGVCVCWFWPRKVRIE